jgi:hypothetical protein
MAVAVVVISADRRQAQHRLEQPAATLAPGSQLRRLRHAGGVQDRPHGDSKA